MNCPLAADTGFQQLVASLRLAQRLARAGHQPDKININGDSMTTAEMESPDYNRQTAGARDRVSADEDVRQWAAGGYRRATSK